MQYTFARLSVESNHRRKTIENEVPVRSIGRLACDESPPKYRAGLLRTPISHFQYQKDYGTTAFMDCVLLLSLPDTLTDVAA
jgi:hypothetical protein